MRVVLIVAICGGLIGQAAATESAGFVHDMQRVLATRGPTEAVAAMTANGDWGRLIARISSGDADAISLVRELANGTDAGTSEELTISLAEALPKAPLNVLGVLIPDRNSLLSFRRVCSAPFIEDSPSHQRMYKAAALRAVRRVGRSRIPDLVRSSDPCIAEMKKIVG